MYVRGSCTRRGVIGQGQEGSETVSQLDIKIRKLQDNGSTIRANIETLYLGGVRSAKVDELRANAKADAAEATADQIQEAVGFLQDNVYSYFSDSGAMVSTIQNLSSQEIYVDFRA